MKILSRLFILLFMLTGPAFAEPGVAVLTHSKMADVHQRAANAKKYLLQLRDLNALDETQFSITVVDLADPKHAATWQKEFEVGTADLPALAYVIRKGNKIADLGTMLRRFPDPMKAAGSAFKYAQTQIATIKVTEILTGFNVNSVPDGATVYVDGEEVGLTPLSGVSAPSAKPVKLELKHPDSEEWSSTYTLQPGTVQNVQVDLRPLDGILRFESAVPASIYLDGSTTPSGTTPLEVKGLRSGAHSVVCKADGYFDAAFTVRVSGNKLTKVVCNLSQAKVKVVQQVSSAGSREAGTNFGGKYELIIELNNTQLAAHLSNVLNADPRFVALAGGADWDLAIKANFKAHGQGKSLEGDFSLMDRSQNVIASQTGKKGIPIFTFDFSGDTTNLAKKMIDEVIPKLLEAVSVDKIARPATLPPTVSVEDIPRQ